MREHPDYLRFGDDVLDTTPKITVMKKWIDEWTILSPLNIVHHMSGLYKLKTYAFWKTLSRECEDNLGENNCNR